MATLRPNKAEENRTFVFLTSALLHFGGARLGHLDGVLAVCVEQNLLQRP